MKDLDNCKITVFGDSIPRGLFLKDNSIKQVENSVVKIIEGRYNIHVDNRSVFGQTLKRLSEKQSIEKYLEELDDNFINYAVVCLGGNDSDFDWATVALNPEFDHQPKTPLEEFEKLLEVYANALLSANVRVALCSIPPVDSQRYFDNVISAKVDKDAVMKFFCGDVTNINRHQECYNAVLIKVALTTGCRFIDFRTDFLKKRDFKDYLFEDGVHPNEKGHALMAERLCCAIESADRLPDAK